MYFLEIISDITCDKNHPKTNPKKKHVGHRYKSESFKIYVYLGPSARKQILQTAQKCPSLWRASFFPPKPAQRSLVLFSRSGTIGKLHCNNFQFFFRLMVVHRTFWNLNDLNLWIPCGLVCDFFRLFFGSYNKELKKSF